MRSIRRRLIVSLLAGSALLIAGTGFYVERLLGERVTEEFDATLESRARALVSLAEQEDGQIEFDYAPEFMPEFEREERPEYFQLWLEVPSGKGPVLYRSSRLQEDLPRVAVRDRPAFRPVALPDGRDGRLVQFSFTPRPPDPEDDEDDGGSPAAQTGTPLRITLVMARGRERLDELIASMRWLIFLAGGSATLLAAAFIWRAIIAELRPLEAIAAQVEALDAEKLDSRITLDRPPVELAPVLDQLNALLDRLQSSFDRERRFTGNVAHELRTPIAELRSLSEVATKWPDDRESNERFFADVSDIAGHMEGVVTDLLLLARCHAGVERVEKVPISLKQVIQQVWSKLAPSATDGHPRMNINIPDELVTHSDPGKLSILLSNVLGNAVCYAKPDSEIECVARREGAGFRLEVKNECDSLEAEDLDRLTEPFWRKDEARSSSEHAGLGLSVVAALASLLGIELELRQEPAGFFMVSLSGNLSGS
ncbi:MAG: ATP-binding protein [Planctomycetota bacterium]